MNSKERVKISDAEWVIMKVLWNNSENGTMTLGDIVRALGPDNKWSYTTIRTLIVRLVDKGTVSVDKTTGVYRYGTLISKDDCILSEVRSFISRVFDDSPADYIAALVNDGDIDYAERQKILRILKDM